MASPGGPRRVRAETRRSAMRHRSSSRPSPRSPGSAGQTDEEFACPWSERPDGASRRTSRFAEPPFAMRTGAPRRPSLPVVRGQAAEEFGMDRFRPNLVVSGTEPWEEDTWFGVRIGEAEGVRIGDAEVRCVVPWPRCAIPQIDQTTVGASPRASEGPPPTPVVHLVLHLARGLPPRGGGQWPVRRRLLDPGPRTPRSAAVSATTSASSRRPVPCWRWCRSASGARSQFFAAPSRTLPTQPARSICASDALAWL